MITIDSSKLCLWLGALLSVIIIISIQLERVLGVEILLILSLFLNI
jgi:hypothetical protein